MTPSITIGYLPRERYVVAAESLASLYANTPLDFDLLVVDPATPDRYLDAMKAVLAGHDNWKILHADRPLLPAASKNLIVAEAATDYLCFVENDNLFTEGWLESLLAACEGAPADVAAPLIREGRGEEGHFDRHLGSLVASDAHPGKWEITPLERPRNEVSERTPVQFVEQHCLLFRRSVFDQIGPYDEELNTRDEVDLSLALHHAGLKVVLEPASVVHYVPPTSPPEPDELPFYEVRWDLARAEASRTRIRDRWSLVDTPGDLEFVKYRNRIPALPKVTQMLQELCDAGRQVVVLDDGDWFGTDVTHGLPVSPFPDAGGHFAGFPETEADALAELQAAINRGTTDIVVGWPAQWWFDFLPGLRDALEDWATSVERDDRIEKFSYDP